MLGEERGDVLAGAVGCVACMDEFAERGVDESHSCGAVGEARDDGTSVCGTGGAGPEGLVVGFEAAEGEELGSELAVAEVHVVSPEKLEADCFGAFVLTSTIAIGRCELGICAVFEANECGVDLTGCNAAQCEVCRQLGGEVFAEETIASAVVVGSSATADNMVKTLMGFGLTAREWMCRLGVCRVWKRLGNEVLSIQWLHKSVNKALERFRDVERLVLWSDFSKRGILWQVTILGGWKSRSRVVANGLNGLPVSCKHIREFVDVVKGEITAAEVS
jgi:hypothetical protein